MKKKFNVSYSVTVDPDEIFGNFKKELDISDCDENDVRAYVEDILEDDDKLRLLDEDDKQNIIDDVVDLYNDEKPDIPIEVLDAREELLKAMNDYILKVIDYDDDIVDTWTDEGIPDYANEEDYLKIASDTETWAEVVNVFAKLTTRETC